MILVFLYTLIMVSFGISAKLIRLLYDSVIQNKQDKEQLDSYVQVLCHPISCPSWAEVTCKCLKKTHKVQFLFMLYNPRSKNFKL